MVESRKLAGRNLVFAAMSFKVPPVNSDQRDLVVAEQNEILRPSKAKSPNLLELKAQRVTSTCDLKATGLEMHSSPSVTASNIIGTTRVQGAGNEAEEWG